MPHQSWGTAMMVSCPSFLAAATRLASESADAAKEKPNAAKADVAASAGLVRFVCFIFAPLGGSDDPRFLPGRCRPPQTAAW